MSEINKEIIRQLYVDITLKKDSQTSCHPRTNGFTPYTVTAKPSSLKAFKNFFSSVNAAFPDYELNLESIIAKGDKVLVRYSISGTQKGNFLGMAPTNQWLTVTGIDIFRIDNGKVVEHWDAAHQIRALPHFNQKPVTAGQWSPHNPEFSPSERKPVSLSI